VSAHEVGFLDSLAWRDGDELKVALHLPGVAPVEPVEVRFRDAERRVRRVGTIAPSGEGSLVEVQVPARRLADGLWVVAVRLGDAEAFTRVEARLLVRPGHPVALLPGPEPKTRLAEPVPRSEGPSAPVSPTALARRVVRGVRARLTR
jgi:hypothetical protein